LNVMDDILKKNDCPRVIDQKEFVRRNKYINAEISVKYQNLLEETNILHKEISELA